MFLVRSLQLSYKQLELIMRHPVPVFLVVMVVVVVVGGGRQDGRDVHLINHILVELIETRPMDI